ncbi:MAG: hypothetical protein LBW85_07670 [Deltaproteobacteria bacterium]|nr:hypothetical protein [Deltaproteobacteria bacterium]
MPGLHSLQPGQTAESAKEFLAQCEGPAVAFTLKSFTGKSWLKSCTSIMLAQAGDIEGSNGREMTYTADVAAAWAFRITRVSSNGFFTVSGATYASSAAFGHSEGTDGPPPLISVSADGAAVKIAGSWKPYDGNMSFLCFLEGDNVPFAAFEKDYFVTQAPPPEPQAPGDGGWRPAEGAASGFLEIPESRIIALAASCCGNSCAGPASHCRGGFRMSFSRDSGWAAVAAEGGYG